MESNIKALRERRGMTQRDLGEMIGVSQQIVSRMEKNRNTIQADVLVQLAEYFCVSTDVVLGYQGEDKRIAALMEVLQMQAATVESGADGAERIQEINARNRMFLYQIALLILDYQQ